MSEAHNIALCLSHARQRHQSLCLQNRTHERPGLTRIKSGKKWCTESELIGMARTGRMPSCGPTAASKHLTRNEDRTIEAQQLDVRNHWKL